MSKPREFWIEFEGKGTYAYVYEGIKPVDDSTYINVIEKSAADKLAETLEYIKKHHPSIASLLIDERLEEYKGENSVECVEKSAYKTMRTMYLDECRLNIKLKQQADKLAEVLESIDGQVMSKHLTVNSLIAEVYRIAQTALKEYRGEK